MYIKALIHIRYIDIQDAAHNSILILDLCTYWYSYFPHGIFLCFRSVLHAFHTTYNNNYIEKENIL